MAKPVLNKAQEQNLAEPRNESNVKFKFSKELLTELQNNTFSGRCEEDVIGHIGKVLEILDFNERDKGHHNENNGEVDKLSGMDLSGAPQSEKINNEQPNKGVCRVDKFEVIKYTIGGNEEFLAICTRECNSWARTVNGVSSTEFLNKTLHAYFAQEDIEHQTSTARTPEQNGVVKRQNNTLVEAARTMLNAAKVPLDGENLDKMKEKGDACIFVGSPETVTMSNGLDFLFSPMFDELLNGTTPVVSKSFDVHAADAPD
ncbi:retrovirus-related pol polyprotein from transposon TNT 1-94 [Tanacetum coccineum]